MKGSSRSIVLIRLLLGVAFGIAGVAKIAGLSSGLRGTYVGHLAGGREWLLVALAGAEIVFGSLLAFGVWTRALCWFGAIAVVVGSTGYIGWKGERRAACGCFGALEGTFTNSIAWFAVRSVVMVAALVFVGASASAGRRHPQRHDGHSRG